jgi:hypothetical protein
MVASQFFDPARATSIHVKLGARNSNPGAPKLYGVSVATFGDFVEMIDDNEDPLVENEPRIPTDEDGHVLRFTAEARQLLYRGVIGCVEEMTNKGLYPKRYFDRVHELVTERAKTEAMDLRFLTNPGKQEQEIMSATEQLEIMVDLCVVKKVRSRMTIHLEPIGELC